MTAVLRDGRREQVFVEHAIGSLQRPMSDAALEGKFHSLADGVIGAERTGELIAALWATATCTDIRPVAMLARS
jgi:2-methylcitrate dehydratase PrpD